MLEGKTALITGASRGIGKAVALKLASKGANIVLNYSNNDQEAQKTAAAIKELGVSVLTVKADISSFDQAKELIEQTVKGFGSVDILINNAGITRDRLLMRMTEQDFDRVIEVNLKGVFNCTRQAVPIMLRKRSGRIINITSVVGIVGNAGQVNYAAAKAGVIGFTKALAKEVGSRGITVNAVAPGFIETDMTAELPDTTIQAIKENITLKKFGKPQNVADAVYFLASDLGEYITGQVLCVDGGMAY